MFKKNLIDFIGRKGYYISSGYAAKSTVYTP